MEFQWFDMVMTIVIETAIVIEMFVVIISKAAMTMIATIVENIVEMVVTMMNEMLVAKLIETISAIGIEVVESEIVKSTSTKDLKEQCSMRPSTRRSTRGSSTT